MALGTVVIAFCPTYATIGVAAPIIVLIGRLLQGFSAGVELGGVSVYLSEISTPGNRGFYTSFQSSSQQVAIFVASIIGYVLSEAMPADTFRIVAAWGWRIPFFIGCLIIPLIFFLRRSLEETPAFLTMKKHPTANEVFASALANWRIVILGMMIAVLTTTTFYFITVYAPAFGKRAEALGRRIAACHPAGRGHQLHLESGRRRAVRPHRPQAGAADHRGLSLLTAYPALHWLAAAPTLRQAAGGRDDVLVLFRRL